MKTNKQIFVYAIFWSIILAIYPWTEFLDSNYFSDQFSIIAKYSRTLFLYELTWNSYIFQEKLYDIFFINLIKFINLFQLDVITQKQYNSSAEFKSISSNVELATRLLIFYILLVWTLFLFKRVLIIPAVLFLIHPTAIDMYQSIIQTSIAYTFILIAIMVDNKKIKYLMIFIAPLVHNSALIISGIFLLYELIGDRLIKSRKQMYLILIINSSLFFSAIFLLNFLVVTGDITIGKSVFTYSSASFFLIIFYILLLILQLMHSLEYLKKHFLIVQMIIIIIPLSFFTPFTFRLIAGLWPLLIYSVWDMSDDKKLFAIIIWIINLVYVSLVWTNTIL